ncbi:MAG TPA: PrsW family glutamic-type intramembrane protease [Chitinophagaceae bacterium]
MDLLLLSILPGFLICLFIYLRDKYNREPVLILLLSFLLGMMAAVPCIFIETTASRFLGRTLMEAQIPSYVNIIFQSFLVIALTEEGVKYFMLKKVCFRLRTFDEPFDGIVYSVMVSMGFATVENAGYVFVHGFNTGLMRMFLSVPAHAAFAVIMGYYVGLAKFSLTKRRAYLLQGFLLAVFFHGIYDSFLFLAENKTVTRYISGALLISGALMSYYVAIRLSLRAIRQQEKLSRLIHDRSKLTSLDSESNAA